MMRLFTAGPSPFGRKVVLALYVTGLRDQVDIIATNTAEPDSENRRLNPLGKFLLSLLMMGHYLIVASF